MVVALEPGLRVTGRHVLARSAQRSFDDIAAAGPLRRVGREGQKPFAHTLRSPCPAVVVYDLGARAVLYRVTSSGLRSTRAIAFDLQSDGAVGIVAEQGMAHRVGAFPDGLGIAPKRTTAPGFASPGSMFGSGHCQPARRSDCRFAVPVRLSLDIGASRPPVQIADPCDLRELICSRVSRADGLRLRRRARNVRREQEARADTRGDESAVGDFSLLDPRTAPVNPTLGNL